MKIYILAAPLALLAACNATPPQNAVGQNTIEDVSANNMIADDVTEVQDETVPVAPPEPESPMGSDGGTNNMQVVR